MKKIVLFLMLTLGLAACEDDVKFNDPAFQAKIDYKFWQAKGGIAEVNNGVLQVYGNDGIESLTLRIPNYSFGKRYEIGVNDTNVAVFRRIVDKDTLRFKSGTDRGSGYVILDPVEQQVPGTVSGKFVVEMVSTNSDTIPNVKLHEGIFYRIPLRDVNQNTEQISE